MRMLYLKAPLRLAATGQRQFILLFLLLATTFSTLCLGSESFADVILYNDLLGVDIGSAFEALPLLGRDSHLVARQSNESRQLEDNSIVPIEILPGTTEYWTFSPSFLNLTNNYTGSTLYITVGACTQPFPKVGLNATEIYAKESPPALQLYYSTDPANTRPGPHSDATRQNMTELSQGFASVNITLTDLKKDVNIVVYAQNITSDWQGGWTYQIGSSTQQPQQQAVAGQNLWVIDTSQSDALITTGNLTSPEQQPFQIYAVLKKDDHVLSSLSNSFCAFGANPSLLTTANADISMTNRGAGGLPKQQFFLHGLNASTDYNIYLTLPLNNSAFGGTVYTPSMNVTTKVSNNCQLVFNLDFCTETAYAAPANPNILNSSALANFYDSLASSLFTNLSTSLQLYPCNTTYSAQYSLFRNCSTCLTAYKNWLCAVTIPRCADVTDTSPYLYPRPVNSSRQASIDQVVQPGAYKEIMPCSDLCWGIEQNCPYTLGFQCPLPGSDAMLNSYVEDETGKTCNAPQLQYLASKGCRLGVSHWVLLLGFLVHLAFLIVGGPLLA